MDFTLPSVVASNLTVRDIAQVAVAGTSVQLQLSNTWSNAPTTFGSVTVGVAQSGATIVPGSIVPVTFGGSRSVTIPASGTVTSDPVAMTVQAGQSLAVSLSVEGSATVSVHYCCKGHIDSYATVNGGGDQTTNPAASSFVFADENMRWLSAIAVAGTAAQGTVVAFGDSITEGDFNAGFGWPNALQARISQLPASQQVALANQSISGNTLTVFPPGASYAAASGGLPGVTRLAPDALSLPGVKTIVLFLGTNDIWFGAGGEDTSRPIPPYGSAPVIEAAMAAVIAATHAAGIKIFGVTLLPRSSFAGGNDEKPELWSPSDQATLAAVNAWILTPGNGFDGTINLAAVMGDVYNGACKPDTPFAPYFTVDNLHPNTAGQTVMADAIPTPLFSIPEAPQVPQPVAVTPTPGCPGAAAAEQVLALGRAPAPPTPPTTPPPTPTTQPVPKTVSHRGSGHTATVVLAAVGAAIVLIIAALLVILRRRAIRRRRQRSPNRRVGLLGSGAHSPGAGHPPTTPESDGVLNRGEGEHALTLPIRMQARGTDIEGSAPHSG
jgi:lysophospholipase L1-like esterase